jgi:hypothetical protein
VTVVILHINAGHLDGTLCLWDLRQSRAGSQPLAEVRAAQTACCHNAALPSCSKWRYAVVICTAHS